MALFDGFFNAVLDEDSGSYDRLYDAVDFTEYFGELIGSGVCIIGNAGSFAVSAGAGGTAVVAPGYLFISGYWLKNDADYSIALPSGNGTYEVYAALDRTARQINLDIRAVGSGTSYTDLLVLAEIVISGTASFSDARYGEHCGVIDASSSLYAKAQYAVNYIDNEIEGRLEEIQASVNGKISDMDSTISAAEAEVAKLSPPSIGTVKYSASGDLGNTWLKCDGRFVSAAQYPDLVSMLQRLNPGLANFEEIMEGNFNPVPSGAVSNAVLYDVDGISFLYFYCHNTKKLYQVEMRLGYGELHVYSYTVSGVSNFSPTPDNPICLSVVRNNSEEFGLDIFLTQRVGTTSALVYKVYNSNLPSTIAMSRLNWTAPAVPPNSPAPVVPYVVKRDGLFYMPMGIFNTKDTAGGEYDYIVGLSWDENDEIQPYSTITKPGGSQTFNTYTNFAREDWTPYNRAGYRMVYGFSPKNSGEMLLNTMEQSTYYYDKIKSIIDGTYSFRGARRTASERESGYGLPVYGAENHVLAFMRSSSSGIEFAMIPDGKKSTAGVLTLNASANIFPDAAIYIRQRGLWAIFIGTGIIFTDALEDPSTYCYMSTTEYLGTVSAYASMDYDPNGAALCIVGQKNDGDIVCGVFFFGDGVPAGTNGAYLPKLYAGEIPGYIKALEE